jgi:hypothetical protein
MDFLQAFVGPIPIPELHARRLDQVGGDGLVTSISGILPFSNHIFIPRHHGHPLWDRQYKEFLINFIPLNLCFPELKTKIGDNVVELSWVRPDLDTNYEVIRFLMTGDSQPSPSVRSAILSQNDTLFYDPVEVTGMLRYLISYQIPSLGSWAHEEDDLAFLDAVSAGSCPVTIKSSRPDDGQTYTPLRTRLAASKAADSYIVFSVTAYDLLTDCIGQNLVPKRERMNVTQYESEAALAPRYRLSEPYASAPESDKDHCIASWIEHTVTSPAPGQTSEEIEPTVTINKTRRMPGVNLSTSTCTYAFRLMAGLFDADGLPVSIQEILPLTESFTRLRSGPACVPLGAIDPPRFIANGDGYVFACTGASPYTLRIIGTDRNLMPRGQVIEINIRQPSGQMAIPPDPSLILYDLFPAETDGRFIALVGAVVGANNMLYVVNFAPDGDPVISRILLNRPTPRCLGAVLRDGAPRLMIVPSSPAHLDVTPSYATMPILSDRSVDTNLISWKLFTFPDLYDDVNEVMPSVRFSAQEVLRRCDTFAEFLMSTTGYFQEREVSSSLYRVRLAEVGVENIENQHHSAYGNYQVTFSRTDYASNSYALFWLTIQNEPFTEGLYGQPLFRAIPICSTVFIPGVVPDLDGFLGDILGPAKLFEILCKKQSRPENPWVPEFCFQFKSPETWSELLNNPGLRTPLLILLKELDRQAKWIEAQIEFPKSLRKNIDPWERVRPYLVDFMDRLEDEGEATLNDQFFKLRKDLAWGKAGIRAEKSLQELNESIEEQQGRVQTLRKLLDRRSPKPRNKGDDS